VTNVQASNVSGSMGPPPPLFPLVPPPATVFVPVLPPPDDVPAVVTTVTCAEAVLVESAAETAITVTVAGEGTVIGAVYTPEDEIMPTVALPPATLLTRQLTAVFDDPVTEAVNVWVIPVCTLALLGVIDIATGAPIVTWAEADFVASATDVAVTVTVAGDGTEAGAV
jgi:hypothetical protein